MKVIKSLLFAIYCLSSIFLRATPSKEFIEDSITVYIFLHESCVISQNHALYLRELYTKYANDHLQFMGLFPNATSTTNAIQRFKKNYNIPFELRPDHSQFLTETFGDTESLEVVVYNEVRDEIIYNGRIGDHYAEVGQKKQGASTSELKDILEAIQKGQLIELGGNTLSNAQDPISKSETRLFLPFPNPSQGEFEINYFLDRVQTLSIDLYDTNGRLVKTLIEHATYPAGYHTVRLSIQQFSADLYTVRLRNENQIFTQPLVITE